MAQQYVVPQFIDVEPKIIGSITTRQFLVMFVDAFLLFIIYSLFTFTYFLLIGLPVFLIGVTFAFAKVGGQPFHLFMLNFLITMKRPRLRVWYRHLPDEYLRQYISKKEPPKPEAMPRKDRPTASRLAELSLIANTGGVYTPEP